MLLLRRFLWLLLPLSLLLASVAGAECARTSAMVVHLSDGNCTASESVSPTAELLLVCSLHCPVLNTWPLLRPVQQQARSVWCTNPHPLRAGTSHRPLLPPPQSA